MKLHTDITYATLKPQSRSKQGALVIIALRDRDRRMDILDS